MWVKDDICNPHKPAHPTCSLPPSSTLALASNADMLAACANANCCVAAVLLVLLLRNQLSSLNSGANGSGWEPCVLVGGETTRHDVCVC